MTLTPSSVRLDLKCGKGAISKGEKCYKGPATKVAIVAATAAAATGVGALLARKRRASAPTRSPGADVEFLSKGTQGSVWVSKDRKTVTKMARSSSGKQSLLEEAKVQEKAFKAGVSTPKITNVDTKKGAISMENLEGYKFITKEAKSRSPESNRNYASTLIDNLSKAHRANIAHGDLNTNVLVKEGKLSIIDWGQSNTVSKKGIVDVLNTIRMADELDPALAKIMKDEFKPIQTKFTKREALSVTDFSDFYTRVEKSRGRGDALRLDLKCGKGAISKGEKCTKGSVTQVKVATGVGLAAGAVALGALASRRRRSAVRPASTPSPKIGTTPRLSGPPRLPGSSPRALLAPAPARKSKTQRMRANTATAARKAEGAIAQTAREEIRRVAQIGNTMATAGEATGMAVKTGLRELRLRTEAARRRFEPGYRAPDQRRLPSGMRAKIPNEQSTRLLEELGQMNTEELRAWMTDPRTGQPRRRPAQGFGRRDSYIQHYAPAHLQPPPRRDTEDGKKYSKTVINPETGRKNKVRYGAKGYRIAPGTSKGDRYCARSFGDMKSHSKDCSGKDRNTPLCLSRAEWRCSGKVSRRDGLTPGKSSAW